MEYLLYLFRLWRRAARVPVPTTAFIGRKVIAGITFRNAEDALMSRFQTHGKIVTIDASSGIRVEKADGSGIFTVPPSVYALKPARPGQYRLRATGEVVINPDYLCDYTVTNASAENISDYRNHGFRSTFQTSRQ